MTELVPGTPVYLTPEGRAELEAKLAELRALRPDLVDAVAASAHVGDRSHDVEYHNSRRALAALDQRIRQIVTRLETAIVVDPAAQGGPADRVVFGSTVTYEDEEGERRTVTIVGPDEAEPAKGTISMISPVGRALMGARPGDVVEARTPAGLATIEIIEVALSRRVRANID